MRKRLKNNFLNIVILLCVCLTALFCFAEEQITITTYYPSPVGVYRELRSAYLAVGTTYSNNSAYCWAPAGTTPCPNPIDFLTSLAVEGRVGIGVANATTTMDIRYVPPVGGNEPMVDIWTVGMNWSSHPTQASPQNFSIRYAPAGGLMGFTEGDGTDALPRGWYVVDTSSGAAQTEFSVNFDEDLIFLNRARVGTAGGTSPALNVTGNAIFQSSNVTVSNTTISDDPHSTLEVRGTSNTCVEIPYADHAVAPYFDGCPTGYALAAMMMNPGSTTSALTPRIGVFTCCKVCNFQDTDGNGLCDNPS